MLDTSGGWIILGDDVLPFSWVEHGSVLHDQSVIRPYHHNGWRQGGPVGRSSASDRDYRTYSDRSRARDPPTSRSIRHVTAPMGHRRNKFVDNNLIWRVLDTGYGVDPFLSDRNVGAVPGMIIPANTLLGTARRCNGLCNELGPHPRTVALIE